MKLSWSVLMGPAFARGLERTVGDGLPRVCRMRSTRGVARGSTSMGIVGQDVRRRGRSLRWSVGLVIDLVSREKV